MTSALPTLDLRPAPREASDRSLPAQLHGSAEPVVVESYFAGWERPWRALSSAAWTELRRALGGRVRGAILETGANRALATRYGLEVIPTVLVFLRGQVVARFTGTVAPEAIAGAVNAALEQERERAHDERELAAATAAPEPVPSVRSLLPRRASVPALAHAG